jgi:hypothetical protein
MLNDDEMSLALVCGNLSAAEKVFGSAGMPESVFPNLTTNVSVWSGFSAILRYLSLPPEVRTISPLERLTRSSFLAQAAEGKLRLTSRRTAMSLAI